MTKPLSATMVIALDETTGHGGKLVRHPGGFWSYPGCTRSTGRPDWYVGTLTVEALVARGKLEYVEWRDGRNGRFPIAAALASPQQDARDD